MAERFGLLRKKDGGKVPLESIMIQVDIQGFAAHVVATMKYTNREDNPIEAIYIFPLDEQAAVCGFQATIDGRTIVAEIQEKQEAQDTYDDAISSGQSAFLLEESDESSDIFQISIGNLPPKKEAVVELAFVVELAVEAEGRVVFVLPTVLNPRYSPAGTQASLSTQIPRATVDSPYSFDFEMKVTAISTITQITSASHALKVEIDEKDETKARVSLSKAHEFDKDLEVHILTCEPFKPQAIVENGVKPEVKEGKDNFLESPVVMLNFFPEFKSSESSEKGEFVFVVDRSGSMSGSRIKSARETLQLFLKSLPDGCYFNVVGFGSSHQTLFKKSELYNDKNLQEATQSAKTMQADLGGTEILHPLQWVFSQPLIKGHPRQLFLLTDGDVGNTKQVIDLVRKNSTTARCFTFGIGTGASSALVKGVARAGKGTAEFIVSQEDRLQAKIIKTLKRALQPVISDVAITWELAEGWTVHQIPSVPPALFSGDRLVVYGLLKPAKACWEGSDEVRENKARLQGSLGDDSKQIDHVIMFTTAPTRNDGQTDQLAKNTSLCLHRLAAKSFIQEQQDGSNDTSGLNEDTSDSVINISKAANVVSKLTSFIAVDKDNHEPVSGPLKRRVVPQYGFACASGLQPYAQGGSGFLPCSTIFGGGPASSMGFSMNMASSSAPPIQLDHGPMPQAPPFQCHPPSSLSFLSISGGAPALSMGSSMKMAGKQCARTPPPPPASYFQASAPPGAPPIPPPVSFCSPPRPASHFQTSQVVTEQGQILELVSLQKASGAWNLTDQLTLLFGTNKNAAIKGCPDGIASDTSEGKELWATALALALLMGKFMDQKDEWEMIAEKGKKWMKKHLPACVKFEDVLEAAANTVGFQISAGL